MFFSSRRRHTSGALVTGVQTCALPICFALGLWQWLYLEPGAFEPDPAKDAAWNRGAYLVRHVTHCGECHSPRGRLGAVDHARDLTGSPAGPDGDRVPGLIEDLADWSESDIAYALKIGMTPEGDFLRDAIDRKSVV